MAASTVPGTEGYAADAEWLIGRYESVAFPDKYRTVMHLLPARPAAILDIGAGTGVDAAWLAEHGHRVTAVEPVAALREAGMAAHPSPAIAWVDDSLPSLLTLATSTSQCAAFDAVLVIAVWMHLSADERSAAMARIAPLLKPGGVLVMSLRHGPAPANRRVFAVSPDETVALAQLHGLRLCLSEEAPSVQQLNRQAGVYWSWLVFEK